MAIVEPLILGDGPFEKPSKWEPAVGVRILRTKDGDKLQQKFWRRTATGFEHEWQDLPVVTEEEVAAEAAGKATRKRKTKTDPEVGPGL